MHCHPIWQPRAALQMMHTRDHKARQIPCRSVVWSIPGHRGRWPADQLRFAIIRFAPNQSAVSAAGPEPLDKTHHCGHAEYEAPVPCHSRRPYRNGNHWPCPVICSRWAVLSDFNMALSIISMTSLSQFSHFRWLLMSALSCTDNLHWGSFYVCVLVNGLHLQHYTRKPFLLRAGHTKRKTISEKQAY